MKTKPYFNRLISAVSLLRCRTLVAVTAAFAMANLASGAQIGINFVRGANTDGQGVQDTFANSLPPDALAGVAPYTQTNWNNLGNRGTNIVLLGSDGAPSGVAVNWVAGNNWSIAGSNPGTLGVADNDMMNCYLDSNNGGNVALTTNLFLNPTANMPLVYLSGLGAWMSAQGVSYYDLLIYADGDNQGGRPYEYWIQNASGPAENMTVGADMTTHVFIRDYNNFLLNPVYQPVPLPSNIGRLAASGNYTVFTGLSADSLLVRTAEFNTRVPINAIQIIPRATASGATLDPVNASQTYAGGRASFRVTAAGVMPMTYQWQKNGAPLSNGGNVSGATTAILNLSGASGADTGNYSVVVSNASGLITSTVAPLTVTSPVGGSYAEKIVINNPVAYWRFNETGDPSTNNSPAFDSVGGFNAIYGQVAQNGYLGIVGPQPTDFPGFEANNSGMQTAYANPTSVPYPSGYISWALAPPLNLNTNTVTMCAWINPAEVVQAGSCGLVFTRGAGSDVSGFGYGANNNLGYTWNGAANTFGFGYGSPGFPENGLQPPSNQWSLVACVITPTNAILYLLNTNGQFSATNAVTHTNGAWASVTMIGDDPSSTTVPQNRAFTGIIDEVAVFNRSLTSTEIQDLYKKGLQITGILPAIAVQPLSLALLQDKTARFSVTASGEAPLSYQWRTNGVNLTDAGSLSGATSPSLTINGVSSANAAGYDVVVANSVGSITSRVATLTVVASNAAAPYEARLRTANPIAYWRLNEASGSQFSYDYWGGNILTNGTVTLGVPGPVPPEYTGIESTNTAGEYDGFSSYSESGVRLMNNLAQFSVIGWFRVPAASWPVGARRGLFGQNDVIEFGYHGNGTDGIPQIGIFTPRGSAFLNQSTNVLPDVWYLIAAVGTGTNVNLYLASTNGAGAVKVLQSTSAANVTTNYGVSLFPFRIGGGGILDGTTNFFPGIIDEVAVFNRAISADELSGLFGAALSGGDLPPTISADPVSQTQYAGKTATFTVAALGSSPKYQWRTNGVRVLNNGNFSGAGTATLTITNVSPANQAIYDVVITNGTGSVTSAPASLTVIAPIGYEAAAIALNPIAYYNFNETNDPSSGTAVANDYWGGHNGTYGAAVQNGFNGIAGPRPADGYDVFESTNAAVQSFNPTPNSYVTTTPLGVTTSNLTIAAWINPVSYADARMGIVFARVTGGPAATGLNFIGTNLNYHWLDNAATYGWDSGLNPPLNQWSFVALVVEPTQATMHLINTNGAQSAVNTFAHAARAFTDNLRIGGDPNADTRTFNGLIDGVAIFNYALTPAQIQNLYLGAPSVSLSVRSLGGNVVLIWPQGTLLEANEVTGPYTTNNAASPYTNAPTAARKFYKVIVK